MNSDLCQEDRTRVGVVGVQWGGSEGVRMRGRIGRSKPVLQVY